MGLGVVLIPVHSFSLSHPYQSSIHRRPGLGSASFGTKRRMVSSFHKSVRKHFLVLACGAIRDGSSLRRLLISSWALGMGWTCYGRPYAFVWS